MTMDRDTELHEGYFRNPFDDGGQRLPGHEAAMLLARDSGWNKARINTAFKFVHDTVSTEFRSQGEIADAKLEACLQRADRLILDSLSPFQSKYYKKTYSDETTAFEACHVVMMTVRSESSAREPLTQLHALRVFLSGEKVETECLPLPLAFRLHAVARMIERSGVTESAMRQVAYDLVSSAALLRVSERISCGELEDAMMIPAFGDSGLLIGRFRPDYPIHEGSLTITTADGTRTTSVPRDPMETAFYEVSTYYGRDIAPGLADRTELRKRLLDWRASNAVACEREVGDMFWAGRRLAATSPFNFTSGHAEELEGLLCEERFSDLIAGSSWTRSVSRSRAAAISRAMNAFVR